MSLLTEKALAASLKKLLGKKTLDKITVRDITDDCGVNRQTFYYHFHDVYDLVEWIFTEETKKFMDECVAGKSWKESIEALMGRLTEDKPFIMNTFYSINRRQLEKFMQSLAKPAIADIASEFSAGMNIEQEDMDFVVNVFSFGLVGLITEWISDGMSQEYKTNIDKFFLIVDGTMEGTLEKFAK